MNQLYGLPKKQVHVLVFATPNTCFITVFLHFSVELIIEQMFDKIRSGLLEQNIFEHMFAIGFIYNHIVISSFYIG